MIGAFGLIILAEPLAQTVSLHANDGVPLLIELRGPAQGFDGYVVLLDLLRGALEILLTDVSE
jgi:hypothetical protein